MTQSTAKVIQHLVQETECRQAFFGQNLTFKVLVWAEAIRTTVVPISILIRTTVVPIRILIRTTGECD